MADIFISYAREDAEEAEAVAKALSGVGWQVFWDRHIGPGETWDEIIEKEIEAARCMLVLWSRNSVRSGWVKAEAEEGLQRKILIPVLIEEAKIPLRFRPVQAASLVDWNRAPSDPAFKQVVDAIAKIIGAPPAREKPEATLSEVAEGKAKFPETALPVAEAIEAAAAGPVVEAAVEESPPSELESGTAKQLEKGPSAMLAVFIALAVVILAGAIWFFWQERQKRGPVIPGPSVTSTPKELTNSIGMEFVLIPAGTFTMGSSTGNENEKPPHEVKISQPFYLQTTEVTQGQWKKVMEDNPSTFKQCGDDCPVEHVSWGDVQRFIEKLSQLEKAKGYRLPSEAEWEHACRASTITKYSFGDEAGTLDDYAWYSGNSQGGTARVAGKKPNPWGLYDMHGNVWEWVLDDYHDSYNGAHADGRAWVDNPRGTTRVIRGGGWFSDAANCRSARRYYDSPAYRNRYLGFRLAMSVAFGS